jgi:hypothetical protein
MASRERQGIAAAARGKETDGWSEFRFYCPHSVPKNLSERAIS